MDFSLLKKIKLSHKVISSIFLVGLFLFGSLFFLIMPTIKDIKNIRLETDNVKYSLELKKTRNYSLDQLLKDYQFVKSEQSVLDNVFISNDQGINFITFLEKIAEKNNVSQSVNLLSKSVTEKDFYNVVPIQISVKGELDDLLGYLDDIEKANYYINIYSLEFSENTITNISNRNEDISFSAGNNMQISANTFWLK